MGKILFASNDTAIFFQFAYIRDSFTRSPFSPTPHPCLIFLILILFKNLVRLFLGKNEPRIFLQGDSISVIPLRNNLNLSYNHLNRRRFDRLIVELFFFHIF